jgi:hypothetical protein
LSLYFLGDSCFNPFIFLFGNAFSNLSIRWVTAQYVGIEKSDSNKASRDNKAKKSLVTPRNRSQEQIKQKAPYRVEKKSKVHGNL